MKNSLRRRSDSWGIAAAIGVLGAWLAAPGCGTGEPPVKPGLSADTKVVMPKTRRQPKLKVNVETRQQVQNEQAKPAQ